MSKNQITLETPLKFIKGVGPKLGSVLEKASLVTVRDIIYCFGRIEVPQKVFMALMKIDN